MVGCEQRWFGGVAALGYWKKIRIRAGFGVKRWIKFRINFIQGLIYIVGAGMWGNGREGNMRKMA